MAREDPEAPTAETRGGEAREIKGDRGERSGGAEGDRGVIAARTASFLASFSGVR